MPRGTSVIRFGLLIAGSIIVLDQLSKWWIVESVMDPPRTIAVVPFFNIVMVWNRGASFGLFNSGSPWVSWLLSAFAIAVAGGLVFWLRRITDRWTATALGLIIGGALGNVIDRLRFGAVADFFDFYVGAYHWPAFNIADSAITVGVAILLIDSLIGRRPGRTL